MKNSFAVFAVALEKEMLDCYASYTNNYSNTYMCASLYIHYIYTMFVQLCLGLY